MRKFSPGRLTATVVVFFIPLALVLLPTKWRWLVAAKEVRVRQQIMEAKRARDDRNEQLTAALRASDAQNFRRALAVLVSLDEPGALKVWQTALKAADPAQKQQAWDEYQKVRLALERKEFIPQITRFYASATEIIEIAKLAGLDVDIWSSSGSETVAAAPPYLLEELRRASIGFTTLYDSIAEFQRAQKQGDAQAQEVAAAHQSYHPEPVRQLRVAIIDLRTQGPPQAGYAPWSGDLENILMQNDRFLAYLDNFAANGTPTSIQAHLEEAYTRHGRQVAGFYSLEEFTSVAPRFFNGRSFNFKTRQSANLTPAGPEGKFHSYDETQSEFTALAQANPGIARVVTLGSTYENHQVFALKISKDPAVDNFSKPDVLITGCYHAREWISVEAPVYFANQLISKYTADETIRYLIDHLQIWIVPIVNPDGLIYSQTQPNELTNDIRLWRKNRRPIADSSCAAGTGVDLNRNYSFQWRLPSDQPCPNTADDIGASDDPTNEIYRGNEPESELEIKAIKSLVDNPAHHFRLQLDYHNFSQLLLYPFGYQQEPAPDAGTLGTLTRRMADEMKKVDGKNYIPEQAQKLYITTGSSIDYAYGVNQIAAPILIEIRPDCCDFNVPENQIDMTNAETWAGARVMLNWATDVPIVQSVRAAQVATGGTFSKIVYAAHWADISGGRQLVIEGKTPGLDYGRIQVRLQFSKPMDASAPPRVMMGRNETINELSFTAIDATEGWQKTVYENDTWIGEAVIPQDADQTTPWRLAVTAKDFVSFNLDANPATVAFYGIGTNKWQNYEAADGTGSTGGTDSQNQLPPTSPGNFLSLFVNTPGGGERLAASDPYTVTWTVPEAIGFIPVKQDLLFSNDGGNNFSPIVQNIPGNPQKVLLTLPSTATTQGRFRVLAMEGSLGNIIFGDSRADFTIGVNVSANMDINFLSSEKFDEEWTDISTSETPVTASGTTKLAINLSITNRGSVPIANPFLRVGEVNRGNVLLSRDRQSAQTNGAQQSFDAGGDNLLSPNETIAIRIVVGLVSKKKFNLSLSLFGVPVGGSVSPGDAVLVWQGKPKSK